MDLQLSGEQFGEFRDALVKAFPAYNKLAQMLRIKLDKRLNTIVGGENLDLNTVTFNLIEHAETEAWLFKLLRAARKTNPNNKELKQFEATLNLAKVVDVFEEFEPVEQEVMIVKIKATQHKIPKQIAALKKLLGGESIQLFELSEECFDITEVDMDLFSNKLEEVKLQNMIPEGLADQILWDDDENNDWVEVLRNQLIQNRVAVGQGDPLSVFQHFGWLIGDFLRKMIAQKRTGSPDPLRQLSFMTEAYQNSLRYLCFIQIAQILQLELNPETNTENGPRDELLKNFFESSLEEYEAFDFLDLLFKTEEILGDSERFVPEISPLVKDIKTTDLDQILAYLENYRNKLIANEIPPDPDRVLMILDEYKTALVDWLNHLCFLASYRLISIKDIKLKYQLGTDKNFRHVYGELHGFFNQNMSFYQEGTQNDNFLVFMVSDSFTFNQSVLLLKGRHTQEGFENIKDAPPLSLSPLIIDESAFRDTPTQTPEIYCYKGMNTVVNRRRRTREKAYVFARYSNELAYNPNKEIKSNKELSIKRNQQGSELGMIYNQVENILGNGK